MFILSTLIPRNISIGNWDSVQDIIVFWDQQEKLPKIALWDLGSIFDMPNRIRMTTEFYYSKCQELWKICWVLWLPIVNIYINHLHAGNTLWKYKRIQVGIFYSLTSAVISADGYFFVTSACPSVCMNFEIFQDRLGPGLKDDLLQL